MGGAYRFLSWLSERPVGARPEGPDETCPYMISTQEVSRANAEEQVRVVADG